MINRTVTPIFNDSVLTDICIDDGRPVPLALLGAGGKERELAVLDSFQPDAGLPVLLGAGMGYALRSLLQIYSGPVAVIDKEHDILALTELQNEFQKESRIFWITDADVHIVLKKLSRWQMEHDCLPFCPVAHTAYLRLDNSFYGLLRKELQSSQSFNYWERAALPRFISSVPRVLLITSRYFLMGELEDACRNSDVEYVLLSFPNDDLASEQFLKELLEVVVKFRPDFVLTFNHLGIDREGVLMGLLEKLRLPVASWFLDNPHLILEYYEKQTSPWLTIFTWDADNIPSLRSLGFDSVHYLPLATNAERFHPRNRKNAPKQWLGQVAFVGNSMRQKVALRLKAAHPPRPVLLSFSRVAAEFMQSDERSIRRFLERKFPAEAAWADSQDEEVRLAYEGGLTWKSTGLYRALCVRGLLPFRPLIVGDSGWKAEFRHDEKQPVLLPPLTYYSELPYLYAAAEINLNSTSKQMKGAVNQRVFDVPASGSFVLTDSREQLADLLEPGKEIVVYEQPEEISDLVKYYRAHESERNAVVGAARSTVLSRHTWKHRLQTVLSVMRRTYGPEQGR